MCDQTPVEYKDGDVVWVKLGPCWWPAEVYDLKRLPEDIISSFRKPPIVAVKFFNEDKYEYVKTIDKIYSYNCTKKNDFIKKGLSLYRSKKQNVMEKFPADVKTAENRTNGDPNIIENPLFSPEVRPDYTSIFGSSKSKKSRKSRINKSLSSSFRSSSSATSTPNRSVTQPRLIKRDEHDVRILVQTPQKLDIQTEEEEKESVYECRMCGYKTLRINLIIMHNKGHVPGRYEIPMSTTRKLKRSPKKRKVLRMTKSSTSSLLEDLQLIEQGVFKATESSDDDAPVIKRPRNENQRKRKKIRFPDTPLNKKEPERKDIRNFLLAEWDDDSDLDNDINLSTTLDTVTETSLISTDESTSKPDELKTDSDADQILVKLDLKIPETSKSCFDFEEEEDESEILSTSIGRKIPRVIPPTDWQKIIDPDISDEDTVNLPQSSRTGKEDTDEKSNDPDLEAFNNLLDTTTVPRLPEIPQLPNFEEQFSNIPELHELPLNKELEVSSELPSFLKNDSEILDSVDPDISSSTCKDSEIKDHTGDSEKSDVSILREQEIELNKDEAIVSVNQIDKVSVLEEQEVDFDKEETELIVNQVDDLVRSVISVLEVRLNKDKTILNEKQVDVESNAISKFEEQEIELNKGETVLDIKQVNDDPERSVKSAPEEQEIEVNKGKMVLNVEQVDEVSKKDVISILEEQEIETNKEETVMNVQPVEAVSDKYAAFYNQETELNKGETMLHAKQVHENSESSLISVLEEQETELNKDVTQVYEDCESTVISELEEQEIQFNKDEAVLAIKQVDEDCEKMVVSLLEEQKAESNKDVIVADKVFEKDCISILEEHETESNKEENVRQVDQHEQHDIESNIETELNRKKVEENNVDSTFISSESTTVSENEEKTEPLGEFGSFSKTDQLVTHDVCFGKDQGESLKIDVQIDSLSISQEIPLDLNITSEQDELVKPTEDNVFDSSDDKHVVLDSKFLQKGDQTMVLDVQDVQFQGSASDAYSPTDEITISIEDKPLSLMEENLLASIEEKSSIDNESETLETSEIVSEDDDVAVSVPIQDFTTTNETCKPAKDVSSPSIDQNVDTPICETIQDTNLLKPLHVELSVQEESSTQEQPIEESFAKEQSVLEQDTKEVVDSMPKSIFDVKPALLRQDSREIIDESIPINPKKRFVRTFEHFEQQLFNEQKKLTEPASKNISNVNISNLKTQVMSKLESGAEHSMYGTKHLTKRFKCDDRKPKSFRDLILERQREEEEEESKYNQTNNFDLDLSEVPKKILDSPLHEELEDSFNVDSSSILVDTDNSTSFIEPEQTETALNLVMQSIEESVSQPEQMQDIDKDLVVEPSKSPHLEETDLQLNHAAIMDLDETLPESKIDKQVDELVSIPPQNADEELRLTTTEGELNNSIEEYVQTCISFSCTEKSSTNDEPEDLSALSTLAAVSELTTSFHDIHNSRHAESSKILADLQTNTENPTPTFLTEDDLGEGQIEIASIPLPPSKPLLLASFSVDFPDVKDATSDVIKPRKSRRKKEEPDLIERSLGRVFADEINTESDSSNSAQHDVEDHIPSAVVCNSSAKKRLLPIEKPEYTSSSKLLEILTDGKPKLESVKTIEMPLNTYVEKSEALSKSPSKSKVEVLDPQRSVETSSKSKLEITEGIARLRRTSSKFDPKHTKFVIKTTSVSKAPPVIEENEPERVIEEVSVQKVSTHEPTDFEDIDAFIIQKPGKKIHIKEDQRRVSSPMVSTPSKKAIQPSPSRGKAKILQQTIIKPGNDTRMTISSNVPKTSPIVDDSSMFDINSMPIVLSDQILTPENIENMPVVLSDTVPSSVIKSVSTASTTSKQTIEPIRIITKPSINSHPMLIKTYTNKSGKDSAKHLLSMKTGKPSIIGRSVTSEKFIIVPTASTSTVTKTPVKRPAMLKKASSVVVPTTATSTKAPTAPISVPTGNKIMIVTNQQGQQSRVLLTPEQQKLIGYQGTGNKLVKSTLKGNILQKASIIKTAVTTMSSKPHILTSSIITSKGESLSTIGQNRLASDRKILISGKIETPKIGRKVQINPQKILLQPEVLPGSSRTIVIKNPQGQVVKKIPGSEDALLEQQVQEQLNAIKASGSFTAMKSKQEVPKHKLMQKRPYGKKIESGSQRTSIGKPQLFLSTSQPAKVPKTELPPLTPISPIKSDVPSTSMKVPKVSELKAAIKVPLKDVPKKVESPQAQQKAVNQLIIRDSLGNQTTITEGQILAFPSGETVDGQTQSYMLVTLDESGRLTPLNNEALLSLDPNLCLGGDLSNMVMQVDNASINQNVSETSDIATTESRSEGELEPSKTITNDIASTPQTIQTVCNLTGSDSMSNQQIIITGDPVSTQKFLESLSEGNQDLANLLATAEGNILIQTDEQQILINTADGENQLLLPVMNSEGTQETGGPLFANPPSKSQDILAAALADTDVFQQDMSISSVHNKLPQLSPNTSGMYPNSVANDLETTLSLSSPIMTPLEVPSTNTKKIPDSETDMLTKEIPKNVDLPITITDPNIAQTVSQQQLLAASSNLDMPLSISDPGGVSLNSTEMNSPSFVYSLPSLDEQDEQRKPFSGPISMPLLNEDSQTDQIEKMEHDHDLSKPSENLFFEKGNDRGFLVTLDPTNADELLGDDLCSSLSEPPPDMFDLAVLNTDYRGMEIKQGATSNMLRPEHLKLGSNFSFTRNGRVTPPNLPAHIKNNSPPASIDENSCEIPVQPPIVTDLSTSSYANNEPTDFSKRISNDDSIENDRKKIKFD